MSAEVRKKILLVEDEALIALAEKKGSASCSRNNWAESCPSRVPTERRSLWHSRFEPESCPGP